MSPVVYVIISVVMLAVSQLLLKQGAGQLFQGGGKRSLKDLVIMFMNPYLFFGMLLSGLGAFSWLLALSSLELSYAFPFQSINYFLVPLFAAFFLREKLSPARIIGILFICAGLVVLSMS
jgi:drug/metabolite transporter (DMT)-like permease